MHNSTRWVAGPELREDARTRTTLEFAALSSQAKRGYPGRSAKRRLAMIDAVSAGMPVVELLADATADREKYFRSRWHGSALNSGD